MFEITVEKDFAAAHRLVGYQGACCNIHGHTWKVRLTVGSNELNEQGMVVDFRALKEALNFVLNKYDHKMLNEIAPFDKINPTAENLSCQIYKELKLLLKDCLLLQVSVWESANSWATYREG